MHIKMIGLVIISFIIGGLLGMSIQLLPSDSYVITDTQIYDGKLYLHVSTTNSASYFTGFTYKTKGNNIYLSVRMKGYSLHDVSMVSGGFDMVIPLAGLNTNVINIYKQSFWGGTLVKTININDR